MKMSHNKKEVQEEFSSITLKLASPESIKAWSYGEVKKSETINYRSLKPEKEGLFCEKIFGTSKEWECFCGKYRSIRYKGTICEKCGVEVTSSKVRRERMGHIELATPVSHIWYYRSVPSRIGLLLDLNVTALKSVIYYEKYIVTQPGDTDLKLKQIISEEEYYDLQSRHGVDSFQASMGAEALKILLNDLNLDALALELRETMRKKNQNKIDKKLLRRLKLVEDFRTSKNKPSWMILDVLPVLPPELRPMVQLDTGRFATSDLNDLYRKIINRNSRIKRLLEMNAPDIILRNEKRMLQEAVDALFDNSSNKKSGLIKSPQNRALKSLSDILRGKQGRFRQNLLGKRVDYSGRSVIVVGPELKIHQCGLPIKMALELFKPFLIEKLMKNKIAYSIRRAKSMIEREETEIFKFLQEVVKGHPVMLNRAPTLHRLGIQAFEPILVESKAIKLHPLVCHAFNADFDGDQMAVHVPLTNSAQIECWTLMLSARNLLNPASGKPITFPSQDMVLGVYTLTKIRPNAKGEGKYFSSYDEVIMAVENKVITYNSKIKIIAKAIKNKEVMEETGIVKDTGDRKKATEKKLVPTSGMKWLETTAGRLILNNSLPKQIYYVNYNLDDKAIREIILHVYNTLSPYESVKMLDTIKVIGFKYATILGSTISVEDVLIPDNKEEILRKAQEVVNKINADTEKQSPEEIHNKITDAWGKADKQLIEKLMEKLGKDRDGFNPIYMMASSGARGSEKQIKQLSSMRGLMSRPNGEIIELPIKASFKDGLSVIEFFISTNGARKGLADTALKTSEAGYLTRKLIDISQDFVVNQDDCGTINGIDVKALKNGESTVERLSTRIEGKYAIEKILHPITGEAIIDFDEEITRDKADLIEQAGIESVKIRTVLTCESQYGVCRKCYGRNLSTGKIIDIGEPVGIIAAQSIGQPGTQLTMRTFHTGGVAAKGISEENKVVLRYPTYIENVEGHRVTKEDGTTVFTSKGFLMYRRVFDAIQIEKGDEVFVKDGQKIFKNQEVIKKASGVKSAVTSADIKIIGNTIHLLSTEAQRHDIKTGHIIFIEANKVVPEGTTLLEFDQNIDPIISEVDGIVKFENVQKYLRETGGGGNKSIEGNIDINQPPKILIGEDENKKPLGDYEMPNKALLLVSEGSYVKKGEVIAKITKEAIKTSDITGGLVTVSNLFNAQAPKSVAVLSMAEGYVEDIRISTNSKRTIIVKDKYNNKCKHTIPSGKYILVRKGDLVQIGEALCDGEKNPHSILRILGEDALHSYLLNQIQNVYKAEGIEINDKHISIIIKQMMRKVEIKSVGDTSFIYNQQVDKHKFYEENKRVHAHGGKLAVARPVLLPIVKTSLSVDSFLSAASFQETTKVLASAAIEGSTDNLKGLKENIIVGQKIPAGTGMKVYNNIKLFTKSGEDLDALVEKELEDRQKEEEALLQQLPQNNTKPIDDTPDENE